jgi:hypothetical protein
MLSANERRRDAPETTSSAVAGETVPISIAAGGDALRVQMGAAAIRIDHLPFVIGRAAVAGEALPRRHPDLVLADKQPFRLSRDHFMIIRRDGGPLVCDLGSTLGTIVDGQGIGHHFTRDAVQLHTGENRIIAGGWGSPFEFEVSVGRNK